MLVKMKSVDRLVLVLVLGATVIVSLLGAVRGQRGHTICDVPGCNCTVPAGGWKNVNCFLLDDQQLTLRPDYIPKEVTEIFLTGGHTITFESKTFNGLKALALLRVEKVRKVILEKRAFYNIQSSSLLVQILDCDDLLFKTQAFDEMQGSLWTEIIGTKYVKLESSPFSKLSKCTFENVGELSLDSGAFEIKNLGDIGRHGPVTVVHFLNVFIPEIVRAVFRSSLAEIAFKDSRVGDINPEAVTTTQISSVLMFNTSFATIKTGAFIERTLVVDFRISKCTIARIQSNAISSGMATLTVNHSTITDIDSKAITSTTAKLEFIGNQIANFNPTAIIIHKWNRISMDQNIIKNLFADFIVTSNSNQIEKFSFKGNEIYNAMEGSLSFVAKLEEDKLIFDDNFFSQSCGCDLPNWINLLVNSSSPTDLFMETSFCTVDSSLSRCFSLPVGIMNMQNFTERACNNNTVCEPYNGETRTINTTGKIFIDDHSEKQNWLIFIVVLIGLFILALIGTFVALLIRGSRWLKRKGYFRNNYYNNNQSNEEENTIVTIDTENEKLEMPEELTAEFLQELSRRLDDPSTHQEASEMIERLYEMWIVDDSYENNNREEEAHLYEELGNLNREIPPPPYEEQAPPTSQPIQSNAATGPRGILKLMEEKFNTNGPTENEKSTLDLRNITTNNIKPILTGDYSEPIDRDVHLYSELKQKDESKKDSVKSNGSMALRPLPDKPGYLFEAGPSTKL